jgi:hypothetical protein
MRHWIEITLWAAHGFAVGLSDRWLAVGGLGTGDVTPSEAGEIAKLVEILLRTKEASEFEQRLKAIEERINAGKP